MRLLGSTRARCVAPLFAAALLATSGALAQFTLSSAVQMPVPSQQSFSVPARQSYYIVIPLLPPYSSSLTLTLTAGRAEDADLFVGVCSGGCSAVGYSSVSAVTEQWRSTNTAGVTDSVSTGSLSTQMNVNPVKALYVRVYGFTSAYVTLRVAYTASAVSATGLAPSISSAPAHAAFLAVGGSTAALTVASNAFVFFVVPLSGLSAVTVFVTAAAGDPDLYLSRTPPESADGATFRGAAITSATSVGSDRLLVTLPTASLQPSSNLYIGVHGFSAATFVLCVTAGIVASAPALSPTATPSPSLTPALASNLLSGVPIRVSLTLPAAFVYEASTSQVVSLDVTCSLCTSGDNFGVRVGTSSDVLLGSSSSSSSVYYADETGNLPMPSGSRRVVFAALQGSPFFVYVYNIGGVMNVTVLATPGATLGGTLRPTSGAMTDMAAVIGGVVGGAVGGLALVVVIVVAISACARTRKPAVTSGESAVVSWQSPTVVVPPAHPMMMGAPPPPPQGAVPAEWAAPMSNPVFGAPQLLPPPYGTYVHQPTTTYGYGVGVPVTGAAAAADVPLGVVVQPGHSSTLMPLTATPTVYNATPTSIVQPISYI